MGCFLAPFYEVLESLIGGWTTHPSEKYAQVKLGFIFPNFRGEKFKKYLRCHHLENSMNLKFHEVSISDWGGNEASKKNTSLLDS